MHKFPVKHSILLLASLLWLGGNAFNSTVKFSDDFYAAQKYFYSEAKKKFSKITLDKFYPEIPVRGIATSEQLKNIAPLTDFFEARQKIVDEAAKYPEQVYTEIFAFLNGHPGANEGTGNKPKFEALEKYFYQFIYLFSADKHYALNAEIRTNPCPVVFCLKDEKKNSISFKIFNSSKKNFSFNLNETLTQSYFTLSGKKPIDVKAGQTVTIKLTVNVMQLKKDSAYKVFNFVFADPAQPRVKILVPVVLLPSKDFLSLPAHFYDFRFSYSTFFKNIDMYKDRTSGPVSCVSGNCSGEKYYLQRSADRSTSGYDFGDLASIQYNVTTAADAGFNAKNTRLKFAYNELGSIQGQDRNCPGNFPNSSAPCPTDAMNNGKQLYGKRKLDFKMYLPAGKTYTLKTNLRYFDLVTQLAISELNWLQEKKLVISITDASNKEIAKAVASASQINFDKTELQAGTYSVSVYTATENEGRYNPGFELNHLNHANRSRFDFTLTGSFSLVSFPAPMSAGKK